MIVFGPYLQVLRRPGAARFSGAGMLARLQMSMAGIGSVMLLSAERNSFTIAGTVTAIYALSAAIIGPQISRQIDMRGQRRVVPIQLMVHLPTIAAMIVIAVATELNWPIFLLAFVAGASQPTVGPLVRTRWSAMLSGTPQLRTAFAWESLVDEAVFMIGPPLATVLALQLFPSAGLIMATIFLVVGTTLLLTQRATEPVPAPRTARSHGRPAILLPGVAGLAAIFVLVGGIFGSFEVATIAFTKEAGHPGAAGLLLAIYSGASLIGGMIFGVLHLKASLLRQFMFAVVALTVVTLPIPFMGSLVLVGVGLLVAGVACSPVLISGMSLVESVVPSHRLTEAMSWTNSGMAVGLAVATPLAGRVIDIAGASTAYWVTAGCAVGALVIALLVLPSLKRARDAVTGQPVATETVADAIGATSAS